MPKTEWSFVLTIKTRLDARTVDEDEIWGHVIFKTGNYKISFSYRKYQDGKMNTLHSNEIMLSVVD